MVDEEFTFAGRIPTVRVDSMGSIGEAPMELLARNTRPPVNEDSHFVFTVRTKNTL